MVSCVVDRPVNKGLHFFFQYSGLSQFGGQALVLEMLWSYRDSLFNYFGQILEPNYEVVLTPLDRRL